jgi:glycerophosphoryl diester phosphodiesterase
MASQPLKVQGHRGARAIWPENTLRGFEYAIEVGVDGIELDLAVTGDGHVVVTHDLKLNPKRVLNERGQRLTKTVPVRALSLAELTTYDVGSIRHPKFPSQNLCPGARIPTLVEVIGLIQRSTTPTAKTLQLNLEFKSVPAATDLGPAPSDYVDLVLGILKTCGFTDRCIFQSFDHRILQEIKKRNADLPISPLIAGTFPDLKAMALHLGAKSVSPEWGWFTAQVVRELHQSDIQVVTWTVNEPREWQLLLDMGVDVAITDDPEALIRYLSRTQNSF